MAASLGDFFPADFQKKHREQNIRPGAVFSVFVQDTTPPKYKRIVILGINERKALIGHFLINSELNLQCLYTDALRNLQIEFTSDQRDYLEHDSFLDCSNLFSFPLDELRTRYSSNASILLGHLSEEDLDKATEKAAGASTISPKKKKMFGLIPT
ncbi:MAG: hypothetical protein L3J63_06655 [Geopsychrobacter sp.]|nr:hypothetical protein [Geopsychrobacter sp.]